MILASANETEPTGTDFYSLPEYQEGEPCFPDRLYKNECNTCRCTKDRSLMCTKMACFNWKEKKTRRDGETIEKAYLPIVAKGILCKPGKLYRSKCKRCYCTEENKIVCSKKPKEACTFDKYGNPPPITKPEDIHSMIKSPDTLSIPSLPSASEKCSPGKSYKVDCNLCLCLDNGNLVCQQKMCLSYDDMNRIEAKAMSGKPCKPDEPMQSYNCKTCKCVNSKTICSVVRGCTLEKPELQQLKGRNPPPELYLYPDSGKFECQPHTVYKTDCNKCYCQENGSLRCTQKSCLNYSQVKLLEEQQKYLEIHGL